MKLPPRRPLAHLPTPLEPLPRLTAQLGGPELWIKRDEQTGLAGGGNKARKLEYLLADAQTRGARTLITGGAAQSNHCRQTAAAAARVGLRCIVVLRGERPAEATGNILLDELLGAEIVWAGAQPSSAVMQTVYEAEAAAGRAPYLIPLGGSNALGAVAYVVAMNELIEQLEPGNSGFTHICLASASGSTHAGLALGAKALMPGVQVLGFSVDQSLDALRSHVAQLATETAALLELPFTFTLTDIAANADYRSAEDDRLSSREREAIRLLAQCEGVLLDPVFTGKAFGGLIDLISKGEIGQGERVLFWHTGGQPALFAYAEQLI